jgi:hypothetical protein
MTLLTIVKIEHGQEGSRLKLISYRYFSFEFLQYSLDNFTMLNYSAWNL